MSEQPKRAPIGWVVLDEQDVVVGAIMGPDAAFLLPLRTGDRLRVFYEPVTILSKFME